MPRQSKGLSEEELYERRAAGPRARKGPRVDPGASPSAAGYRVPERYSGTRHRERDREIFERIRAGQTPEQVREGMGLSLSPRTISYIGRYFHE